MKAKEWVIQKSNLITVGIITIITLFIAVLTAISLFLPILIIVLIISVYLLVVKYPEISFAVFLTAGVYKGDPRLKFLPDFLDLTIMFGILSVLGIAYGVIIKRIRFIVPSKQVLVPYLIIDLLGILSLVYTIAPIYGTDKLLRFLTITSLALFAPYFLFQKKEFINRFFSLFIVLAILMLLDILSKGLFPQKLGFYTVFGANYLAVGRIIGTALIMLLFYFLMSSQGKIKKVFYLSLIPPMLFGMFLSGGRGPLIAFIITILMISILIISRFGKNILTFSTSIKKTDVKVSVLIIILCIVGIIIFINFSDYFTTFIYRIEILIEGGGGSSALERMERFKKSIEPMISFPTGIIGLGIGGFSVFYGGVDDKRGAYPHNIFLELGSEIGMFGLFAFTFLMCWSFLKVVFNTSKNTKASYIYLNITIFGLLVFMIINSSVSGDINDNRLLFTWIGLIDAVRRFT